MESRMNAEPVALIEEKLFNNLVDGDPFNLSDDVHPLTKERRGQNAASGKKKKDKDAYRLYPLYCATKQMLHECEPTVKEMGEIVDGELKLSETAEILIKTYPDEKESIETLIRSHAEIHKGLDECKAGWIKDKVIQGRYSAKGHRYVELLNQLNESALAQAALVISIINTMGNMLQGTGEVDG